jgi:hypothetical protein
VVLADFKEPLRSTRDAETIRFNERYIFGSVRVALGYVEDASDFEKLTKRARETKLP